MIRELPAGEAPRKACTHPAKTSALIYNLDSFN